MAELIRLARFRHLLPALVAASAVSASCGGSKGDHAAPVFAGAISATAVSPGVAHISWNAASDASGPVTYEVFVAAGPGAEAFGLAPAMETQSLSADVAGLPVEARPSYFVVRARDAKGNVDANTNEVSLAFLANRLVNLAEYPEPSFATGDIAVEETGNIVAMSGFISNPQVRAYLFDVSSASAPVLVNTLYGPGRSTDVEIAGNYLYVSTEEDTSVPQSGVYIYDISNAAGASQTPVATINGPGLGYCHTIWLDGNILYCASTEDGYIHLIDVTNPLSPIPLSKVGIPGGQIHDMYVKDGFAVGCFLNDGWAFLDVSDPMNPVLKQRVQYQHAFTHNAWPTADLHYLYTTDETSQQNGQAGHLRVWDISDHDNVTQVADVYADPGAAVHAIVHNVKIIDGYAWVAWYEDGVQIFDLADPVHPALVGFYDTWTQPTESTFDGTWGVAPKPPYVYASDLDGGLFVMKLDP